MAAEDTKSKKRKGASDAAPKAKKPKKSDVAAPVEKSAKVIDSASTSTAPAEAKPVKKKSARKEAADFVDDDQIAPPATDPAKPAKTKKAKAAPKGNGDVKNDDALEETAPVEPAPLKKKAKKKTYEVVDTPDAETSKADVKKSKKGKQAKTTPVEDNREIDIPTKATAKKGKAAKKNQKQEELLEETATEINVVEEGEEDDQTAALLAGFESDGDQEDPEEDVDWGEDAGIHSFTTSQRKELATAEKAAKASKSNEPGVIYVGRVPRGFFEAQMKKYFSQFGTINRLRLSRNKKTGASKHYAFVEFASAEVADIVARTMDNYLMFGHILKCKVVPTEQVHPELFKGAGERFKVDPRNKKAGLQMERGAPRAQWEKRIEKETKKRADRAKDLKETLGYEYTPSELKSVDDVPMKELSLEDQEQQKLLAEIPAEDTPMADAVEEKKKGNAKTKAKAKGKKTVPPVDSTDPAQPASEPKVKKASKRKAPAETHDEKDAEPMELTEPSDPVPTKKAKKAKKQKTDLAVEAPAVEEAAAAATTESTDVPAKPMKEKKKKVDPEQKAAAKPKKAKKAKA